MIKSIAMTSKTIITTSNAALKSHCHMQCSSRGVIANCTAISDRDNRAVINVTETANTKLDIIEDVTHFSLKNVENK